MFLSFVKTTRDRDKKKGAITANWVENNVRQGMEYLSKEGGIILFKIIYKPVFQYIKKE